MEIDKETLTEAIPIEDVEEFIDKHPLVKKWILRKSKSTRPSYVKNLMRYLRTLEANDLARTPQDVIDLAKENGGYGTFHADILEEIQTSCEDVFPEGTKSPIVNITTPVRSFYSFQTIVLRKASGNLEMQENAEKRWQSQRK